MNLPALIASARRAAVFLLVCVAGLAGPALADPVKPAEARAVRTVVQAQLAAFARDDAATAFSFAAPGIREMFGTPQRFMAMVRAQYPMVHRPASTTFLKPEIEQGEVFQRVQLTDAAGAAWIATYAMQRGKDGRWRIGGCVVAPAPQRLNT